MKAAFSSGLRFYGPSGMESGDLFMPPESAGFAGLFGVMLDIEEGLHSGRQYYM